MVSWGPYIQGPGGGSSTSLCYFYSSSPPPPTWLEQENFLDQLCGESAISNGSFWQLNIRDFQPTNQQSFSSISHHEREQLGASQEQLEEKPKQLHSFWFHSAWAVNWRWKFPAAWNPVSYPAPSVVWSWTSLFSLPVKYDMQFRDV